MINTSSFPSLFIGFRRHHPTQFFVTSSSYRLLCVSVYMCVLLFPLQLTCLKLDSCFCNYSLFILLTVLPQWISVSLCHFNSLSSPVFFISSVCAISSYCFVDRSRWKGVGCVATWQKGLKGLNMSTEEVQCKFCFLREQIGVGMNDYKLEKFSIEK